MKDNVSASRPKIYRLPQHNRRESGLYVSRTLLIVCFALLVVAVIPALWKSRGTDTHKATENASVAESSLAPSAAPPVPQMIHVQDDRGQMVGQLVQMPADLERNVSIHTTSKVDAESSRELMNIISKH